MARFSGGPEAALREAGAKNVGCGVTNRWPCGFLPVEIGRKATTMEVRVRQVDGVKFSVQSRSHTVLCDQPAENGGQDSGMTPPEFLLASLGSCAAFYAVQYLKARKLALGGVEVSVTAEKLKQPARVGNFRVQVTCPVPLTADQEAGLMRSVESCLIHNTLLSPPEMRIELTTSEAAPCPA
jgi:uncharacterized OsmC-like protein